MSIKSLYILKYKGIKYKELNAFKISGRAGGLGSRIYAELLTTSENYLSRELLLCPIQRQEARRLPEEEFNSIQEHFARDAIQGSGSSHNS